MKKLILLGCMCMLFLPIYGQTDPCDLDPFCDDPDGMENAPLDGGIGVLVGVAIYYGTRRRGRRGKRKCPAGKPAGHNSLSGF